MQNNNTTNEMKTSELDMSILNMILNCQTIQYQKNESKED